MTMYKWYRHSWYLNGFEFGFDLRCWALGVWVRKRDDWGVHIGPLQFSRDAYF